MKKLIAFCCEFCDCWFWDQADCERHEAEHFHLTRREYLDWRLLNNEAAKAGIHFGCCNNERTRKEFDDAVKELCDFEEKHGVAGVEKKPRDFF